MNSSNCIEQQGIVENIDNDIVSVKISQVSACLSCDAKSICHLFGTGEKQVDIADNSGNFHRGEKVGISITRSMGTKAVILGYFVPFLLVMLTLILLTLSGVKEWITGVFSLIVLVPYFILLRIFRNKLNKQFNFKLIKIE